MALRGRKPKPDALKKIQGNPGRRKVAQAPAASDQKDLGAFSPPASLNAVERRIWEEMLGTLRHLNFVRESDLRAFARMVKFHALFDAIAPLVTVDNLVETTVSDKVTMQRVSKHFFVMERTNKILEGFDERFGTNPAARQALLSRLASSAPQLFDQAKQQAKTEDESSKKADAPAAPPPPAPAMPASPVGFGRPH
ncbi:MAG TPA: P27 family phage terminase small subunit [Bosea sp. (in: a-proteobacteria)]|jgi:phage terminase small subunit|nr:P27 family phage terminase small subunit [Bosea sp. (in: a-proteobacteria)]